MVSEYGANAGVSGSLSVSGSVTFKGESDVNVDSNTLFVDASTNRVGVGTTTPISALDVAGKLAITSEVSTPSQPSNGHGYLYAKSDGKIYWRSYDVSETDLTAGGGGSGISHDGSTADGVLTYKDSDEATVESNLTFDGSTLTVSGDVVVNEYITHNGDADTWMRFTDDEITFKAGNKTFITLDEKNSAPHEITLNDGGNNIDFVVKGNGSNEGNPLFKCDASTGRVGINGVGSPDCELHVDGDVKVVGDDPRIKIDGDVDSHPGLELYEDGTRKWIVYNNYANDNLTFKTNSNVRMTIAQSGLVGFTEGFEVGSDAAGDILYHNGTSYVRLAKGTADQVLTMNDAATAPNWEDASGGGNEYYHITLSGRVKNTSGELFGHAAYPYNAGDADWATSLASHTSNWSSGDTTFTGTYAKGMLYWTIGVAPAAMSLTSARIAYYMANDNMSDDYIWEVWKATPTTATAYSTDLTWTRLGYIDRGGDPASETFYAATGSIGGSNSLAAGDLIGLTVHNPGDTYTSKYHGYHLALRFTYS